MLLAVGIFLATLVLVIWQPRGLGIGWSALGGAAVALAAKVVQLSDIPVVWDIVWNATLTFVAVIIICSILDEAGFFEWAALHVARWARGNGSLLFKLIVVLGAAIAALFANDGAALVMTPIVFQMILALRFSPGVAFGLVIATGFIADTTSLPFVVSNLVNIVIADFFGIGFARYALVMVPVALVSLGESLVVLRLFFRKSIPGRYDVTALRRPAEAVTDPTTFRAGVVVLGALLVGYFAADAIGIPVAVVAALCAVVLALIAARRPRPLFRRAQIRLAATGDELMTVPASGGDHPATSAAPSSGDGATPAPTGTITTTEPTIAVWSVVRSAPWQIVMFSLGMYLVVYGLRNEGLTDYLGQVLAGIAELGGLGTVAACGFMVGLMSLSLNNVQPSQPVSIIMDNA